MAISNFWFCSELKNVISFLVLFLSKFRLFPVYVFVPWTGSEPCSELRDINSELRDVILEFWDIISEFHNINLELCNINSLQIFVSFWSKRMTTKLSFFLVEQHICKQRREREPSLKIWICSVCHHLLTNSEESSVNILQHIRHQHTFFIH